MEQNMKKRKLGTTDLYVTPVAFGVLTMGGSQMDLPLQEGAELIRYAIDQGINFFDTVMGYQNGTSEEYLGRAIRSMARRAISAFPTASRGSWPKPTCWRSGRDLQNSSPCRDITI